MLSCTPTPHRTCPSGPCASTYATAVGVRPRRDGVLGVVEHLDVDVEIARKCVHERGDRPVARPTTVRCSPLSSTCAVIDAPSLARCHLVSSSSSRRPRGSTPVEGVPHLRRRDLGTGVLGDVLDRLGELDLEPAWQIETVLGLHDVRDAALARLAVDADDGLVRAADVLRVDRQIRHRPGVVVTWISPGLSSAEIASMPFLMCCELETL